jgi:hypothetical protein
MPGIKEIVGKEGLLRVTFSTDVDERLIREPWGIDDIDKIQRPKKRFLVKGSSSCGAGSHDPFLTPFYEKAASKSRGSIFVPTHIFVTQRKLNPGPKEHPFSYSRVYDTSDQSMERIREDPRASAYHVGAFFQSHEVTPTARGTRRHAAATAHSNRRIHHIFKPADLQHFHTGADKRLSEWREIPFRRL